MLHISVTSKLDGVRSWSLNALETCPGSLKAGGGLVDACAGCYAVGGNYRYPNVRKPRDANREDWYRQDWRRDMVAMLSNDRYFRWFDSGDMYHINLTRKIYEVMRDTPWCQHWLPTRMHKFPKFMAVIQKMQALPNVAVRLSSDSVMGEFVPGLHGSTILPSVDAVPDGVMLCHAAVNDGKCGSCRACYDKTVPVIGYVAHGRSMMKVVREATARAGK
jgi:hypothetical protein